MEVALPPGFVVALGELRMGWLAMCTQMAMNAQGQAARFTTTLLYGVVSTWSEGGGHELRAELVITGQDANHYFDLLHADRHDVEEGHEFGDEMEWYNPTGVQQRKIYWRLRRVPTERIDARSGGP